MQQALSPSAAPTLNPVKRTVQNTSLRITTPASSPGYSSIAASSTNGPASVKYGFSGLFAPGIKNESHVSTLGFSGNTAESGFSHTSSSPGSSESAIDENTFSSSPPTSLVGGSLVNSLKLQYWFWDTKEVGADLKSVGSPKRVVGSSDGFVGRGGIEARNVKTVGSEPVRD